MGILRNQSTCGYERLEEWDPEERAHREAQFLIYKTLQKADKIIAKQSKSGWLVRLRFCKLKVKVGRRLRRLRRGVVLSLSKARAGLSKRVSSRVSRLWASGSTAAALPLPPM